MKKTIFYLSFGIISNLTSANSHCFLVKENNQFIKQEGECRTRYAPCSTFKIAISLMGYNEGLLIDETHPKYPFQEGYVAWLKRWQQSHNPRLWLKNSCVWYSQVLTKKLGMKKFQEYVRKFKYGNQDVSGDKGKNNGLTNSWLSSSLKISPEEQIHFLQKMNNQKLPVEVKALKMTENILYIEDLASGWKLFGKTGNGSQLNKDKTKNLDHQLGWFVGWIQKANRKIVFAKLILDKDKQESYASLRAKSFVKKNILKIVGK